MGKKISILVLLSFIIVLGFLRDFLFVHLNYQLAFLYNNNHTYFNQTSQDLFQGLSYLQLYYGKYLLTFVFSLLYYLCALSIHWLLFKKYFFKQISVIYTGLTLLAFGILTLGYCLSKSTEFYPLSRYIMGFVQSPILICILVGYTYLEQKPTHNQQIQTN